mmetsp:Transcript_15080/g.38912  ORF Transcript_15080/g.38912 Transcript_15080/m.38912 type:complete len:101 (-) Transcript_15080:486-788(-)
MAFAEPSSPTAGSTSDAHRTEFKRASQSVPVSAPRQFGVLLSIPGLDLLELIHLLDKGGHVVEFEKHFLANTVDSTHANPITKNVEVQISNRERVANEEA